MPWLHKYRILARPEQLTNSEYLNKDPEKQFPSLNFVSLHNIDVSEDNGNEEEAEGAVIVKLKRTAGHSGNATPEQVGEEINRSRLLELEEENRLLKEALARATQSTREGVRDSANC